MEDKKKFGEEDFYRLARNIAKNFYGVYNKHFKLESIDVEDLIQEAYIVILELPKKTKNFTGYSLPLIKQAVTWKLCTMVRDIKTKYGEVLEFIPLDMFLDSVGEGDYSFELSNNYTDDRKLKTLDNPKEIFKMFFQLEKIKEYLTPKQYQIVLKRIEGHLTFEEIAEELGCSQPYVCQTYNTAIKKLKDRIIAPNDKC